MRLSAWVLSSACICPRQCSFLIPSCLMSKFSPGSPRVKTIGRRLHPHKADDCAPPVSTCAVKVLCRPSHDHWLGKACAPCTACIINSSLLSLLSAVTSISSLPMSHSSTGALPPQAPCLGTSLSSRVPAASIHTPFRFCAIGHQTQFVWRISLLSRCHPLKPVQANPAKSYQIQDKNFLLRFDPLRDFPRHAAQDGARFLKQ
jgi:hypothetical protein